jgi:hypothetical protein
MTNIKKKLLDINSLLSGNWTQCKTLIEHSYPLNSQNIIDKTYISEKHLLEVLDRNQLEAEQTPIDFIQTLLNPKETLSPEHFSLLRFADQLFSNYFKNSKLHPLLIDKLLSLRIIYIKEMFKKKLPWQFSKKINSSLNSIYVNSIGWQPELGRAADRYLKQLSPLISDIKSTDAGNHSINALECFFNTEQQRIKKLEKRIYDAELGMQHSGHAQQLSARTLNQQMAGKKLPENISAFLQGPWHESMRLVIINNGQDSEPWQRILRLTETLIWSFQPIIEQSVNYRQDILKSISELSEQLRKITIGLQHSDKLEEELLLIEAEHLKVLKGEPLSYHPFELINNTDPLINPQVSVSNSLIQQALAHDEGQWFFHQTDDGVKRIKLTIKIPRSRQLLFTNFAGMKASQYSFEEFAYMLSSKIITPIAMRDPFKATGEKIIGSLLSRYQQQQQQAASDAALEEEFSRQQEIIRKAAREQALAEATAFSQEQKSIRLKAQQEELEYTKQEAAEKHKQSIHTDVTQLNIGATVIFYGDKKQGEHCKLVATIKSTNELIFVNRQGVKVYGLNKEQLTERLLDDSAKIISLGSNFDSTLEKVVNDLRTRK